MNRSTARNFIVGEVGLECIQMDITWCDRAVSDWVTTISAFGVVGVKDDEHLRGDMIKLAALAVQVVAAVDRRRPDAG